MMILKGHRNAVKVLAFSPDGLTLASAGQDATVRLWDLVAGKVRVVLHGHERTVAHLAFSPDGQTLASGGWDHTVRLWRVETGQSLTDLPAAAEGAHRPSPYQVVRGLCYARDGRHLLAAGMCGLSCWQIGDQGYSLAWHRLGWVCGAVLAPAGDLLATANSGPAGGVQLWQVREAQDGMQLEPSQFLAVGLVSALSFALDGRTLAGACGTKLEVCDTGTGKEVFAWGRSRKHFQSVAFSPDGTLLAAAHNDGTVRVWHTSPWQEWACFDWGIGKVLHVAFAPDGMRAAAGGLSGRIVLWDVDRGFKPW